MDAKFSYIALAIAIGSLAVSGTVGLFALAGSGATVAGLSSKVAELERRLESADEKSVNNRLRIDELDLGLTAVTQLSGIEFGKVNAVTQQLRERNLFDTGEASQGVHGDDEIDFTQFLDEIAEEDLTADTEDSREPTELQVAPLSIEVKVETPARVDGILAQRLSAAWKKPQGDLTGLKATLRMKLTRDGSLSSVELQQSSGNTEFDESALQAIRTMGKIAEVGRLSEDDYERFYQDRALVFAPN